MDDIDLGFEIGLVHLSLRVLLCRALFSMASDQRRDEGSVMAFTFVFYSGLLRRLFQ